MTIPDPFYDEFHRLQPEVRIVLLPPVGPTVPPSPSEPEIVPEEVATDRATQARDAARKLLVALWATAAAGSPAPATMRQGWSRGERPGEIRARASGRWEGAPSASLADVTTVIEQLAAEGWDVRELRGGGDGRRVVAERGTVHVEVTVWGEDGPWDVELSVGVSVGGHGAAIRQSGTVTTAWDEPVDGVAL